MSTNSQFQNGGTSSSLIEFRKTRVLYANYIVQQQKLKEGCQTQLQLGNEPGAANSGLIPDIKKGGVFTTTIEQDAILAENHCSELSTVTVSTVADAPVIVTITAGNKSLIVIFTAPSSNGGSPITSYRYLVNGVLDPTILAANITSFTITGLTNGASYSIQIYAVNAVGPGPNSVAVSGIPATIPGAPTIGIITRGIRSLTVAFSAPGSNGGTAITSYRYLVDGLLNATVLTNTNPFTITGLADGTSYSIEMYAVNAIGSGPNSAAVIGITFGVPGKPIINTITGGNTTLTVAFSAPASNGGSAITSYRYLVNGVLDPTILAANITSFTITGLTNGASYSIQIYAVNAVGPGPNSVAVSGIPQDFVPAAPTITSIIPSSGKLTIYFTQPQNGGSAITSYRVYYEQLNNNYITFNQSTSPIEFVTPPELGNIVFPIRIQPINAAGLGSVSAKVDATPGDPIVINLNVTSPNSILKLPITLMNFYGRYLYVNFGNGTMIMNYFYNIHNVTYINPGNYTIYITTAGNFIYQIAFGDINGYTGAELITSVASWGELIIGSLAGAFRNAINLISIPATLNTATLSEYQLDDVSYMFYGATKFNGDISQLFARPALIKNTSYMFYGATSFNRNLNQWNVSAVSNYSHMFDGAISFNGNINLWVIGLFMEIDMSYMFNGATSFNISLFEWDTSYVTNMERMFYGATSFVDGGIVNWSVTNVTNAEKIFCGSGIENNPSSWPAFTTGQNYAC